MAQVWYSQPACPSPTGTNTTCSNMLVPLGQVVLVPQGQEQTVPICLSHWDRLCLSQLLVPVGHATKRELYALNQKPNAGLKLTTGRWLLVPLQTV